MRSWGRMLTSGMPVVKAAGRAIAYEWIEGDARAKPTLIFLHEGLGSIRQWRDFPLKVAAATGCRALLYDRYGYGQSDVLAGPPRAPRFERWDIRDDFLPGVRCPVLAIQGYDDEYGTMAQLDEIARRVPGPCELLKLERCGHAPFRDQPEATLAALTRFFNQRI